MITKLPLITKKQQEIIKLIYRHRFLNRIQIQALLGHKDYKTINLWLKDLRTKQYVGWYYSTDFISKTKPAIYYLKLNAIHFLKQQAPQLSELRKRYRDNQRSQSFIDRCLLLADCCLVLEAARHDDRRPPIHYRYETETEILGEGYYHFLAESDEPLVPHLGFHDQSTTGAINTKDHYLLEVFDERLPRYRVKKRLAVYVDYLYSDEWQADTDSQPLPIILFACPRTTDLIYAKRHTRSLVAENWDYDDADRPHIRFATYAKLKTAGILGEDVWEEA